MNSTIDPSASREGYKSYIWDFYILLQQPESNTIKMESRDRVLLEGFSVIEYIVFISGVTSNISVRPRLVDFVSNSSVGKTFTKSFYPPSV
ncbi:hypothetical protein CEXT_427701 [Caerostris extrusa]|uniref:Uncharacterized protein n=1 Tax=Caerostris extrusa TaxID=172846 RepID=A0AAV4YBW7_CAEEX|nr:hypothetical protein CEXT_427701 [Caerostris extrusa]